MLLRGSEDTVAVIDLMKGKFFEQRDTQDRYITSRTHLRLNGIPVDLFDGASIRESVDFIAETRVVNGQIITPRHIAIERIESFDYTDTEIILNGSSRVLPGVYFAVSGIPSDSQTRFVVPKDGEVLVGVGQTKEINEAEGYIDTYNSVMFYDREQGHVTGRISRIVRRDFQGNTILQSEQGNEIVKIFNIDEFGVGALSYFSVPVDGVDSLESVTLNIGREPATRSFAFLTIGGIFNGELRSEEALRDGNVNLRTVRHLSLALKDGEGRLRIVFSGYRGDVSRLQGRVHELQQRVSNMGLSALLGDFEEITFIHQDRDIESSYDVGPIHLGYGKDSVTYNTLTSASGAVVLDEAAYENSPVVARVHGLEIVRAGGTDENSDIRFRYQVEDTRPGRDLQRSLSLNHAGRLAEVVNANPKARVALGSLGNAIKGEEIITYNNLQEPVEARDSEGNVIKRWEGVRYGAHSRGGILEEHTIVKARELAPQRTDRTRLTLRNGNFEKETRIGVFGDWLAEIKSGWGYLIAPIVAFLGLLGLGKLFERARIHSAGRATAVKGAIDAAPAATAAAVQAEPLVKSGHGFDMGSGYAALQWAGGKRLAPENRRVNAAEYFVAQRMVRAGFREAKITLHE